MIKEVVLVPLLLIAFMAVSTRFGVPSFSLGTASLIVYFGIGLCGRLLLKRAFRWPRRTSAFSLPVLVLQFSGMALLAASSSFSSSTLDGTLYKPSGVVDFPGVLAIASISVGAVALSMVIVDAFFFGLSRAGRS